MVIVFFRLVMGDVAFREYGWRIPFILSAVLVVLALFIRLRLQETPLFTRLKAEGQVVQLALARELRQPAATAG